mgnify:CR=1 FL=1
MAAHDSPGSPRQVVIQAARSPLALAAATLPAQAANATCEAKAAEKASKSGDLATAAAEKRNQLIQGYATRAAYDAQDAVDKGLRYLKKFEGDIKGLDADYAEHRTGLAAARADGVPEQYLIEVERQEALLAAGWGEDAPILVVQKASWPGEEKIVRGTIKDIKRKCQDEKIASQAMIVASPTLGAADWPDLIRSKLYDPTFGHRFRKASAQENAA